MNVGKTYTFKHPFGNLLDAPKGQKLEEAPGDPQEASWMPPRGLPEAPKRPSRASCSLKAVRPLFWTTFWSILPLNFYPRNPTKRYWLAFSLFFRFSKHTYRFFMPLSSQLANILGPFGSHFRFILGLPAHIWAPFSHSSGLPTEVSFWDPSWKPLGPILKPT